jgi:hypothetical protein
VPLGVRERDARLVFDRRVHLRGQPQRRQRRKRRHRRRRRQSRVRGRVRGRVRCMAQSPVHSKGSRTKSRGLEDRPGRSARARDAGPLSSRAHGDWQHKQTNQQMNSPKCMPRSPRAQANAWMQRRRLKASGQARTHTHTRTQGCIQRARARSLAPVPRPAARPQKCRQLGSACSSTCPARAARPCPAPNRRGRMAAAARSVRGMGGESDQVRSYQVR